MIDPGRAFGTGAHPSTRLCLELLLDERPRQPPRRRLRLRRALDRRRAARLRAGDGGRHRRGRRRGHARERGRERCRDRRAAALDARAGALPHADLAVANISLEAIEAVAPAITAAALDHRRLPRPRPTRALPGSATPAAASSTAGPPTSSCASGRHASHRGRGRWERVRFRAVTAGYLELIRRRPARRLLYALSVATLSFGMLSLVVLLTVERATGSYRDGGFAVAAFALVAGISAPVRGRLVDRRGARRWLPGLAAGTQPRSSLLDLAAHERRLRLAPDRPRRRSRAELPAALRLGPRGLALRSRGRAPPARLRDDRACSPTSGRSPARCSPRSSSWSPAGSAPSSAPSSASPARCSRCRPAASRAHDVRPAPMPRAAREPERSSGCSASRSSSGAPWGSSRSPCRPPPVAGATPPSQARCSRLFAAGSVLGALWYGTRHWRAPVLDRYLRAVLALGLLLAPAALRGNRRAARARAVRSPGSRSGPRPWRCSSRSTSLAPGSGAEALTWVTTAEAGGSAAGSALAGVLATRDRRVGALRSRLPGRSRSQPAWRSCPSGEALTSPRGESDSTIPQQCDSASTSWAARSRTSMRTRSASACSPTATSRVRRSRRRGRGDQQLLRHERGGREEPQGRRPRRAHATNAST